MGYDFKGICGATLQKHGMNWSCLREEGHRGEHLNSPFTTNEWLLMTKQITVREFEQREAAPQLPKEE